MRVLLVLFACLGCVLPQAAQAAYPTGFEPVRGNPADALTHLRIEPFGYDRASRCVKRPSAGALSLQGWLSRHAKGVSWGIVRCERWGKGSASLHAEGRALDWHLDARRPADRREAERLISLLLAPDAEGNPAALARRMGVQEIIWDCRAWFGGGDALGRYSACRRRGVDRTTRTATTCTSASRRTARAGGRRSGRGASLA